MTIQYKIAELHDCGQIANWINSIGFGHIEYLLDGLVPQQSALEHLQRVLGEDPDYSYQNVNLAIQKNNIVGLIFSYDAHSNELKPEMTKILSKDRVQWMKYYSENQISNSWYINTLGVDSAYRRQGIARQLLDLAANRALQNDFQSLSLHVYENNFAAIDLYQSYGFIKEKKIDLSAHSFFSSRNLTANYLMKCKI